MNTKRDPDKTHFSPSFIVILSVVGYLIQFVLNAFLARHLPIGFYGDFSVALRVQTIMVPILLLGVNDGSKRFLSKYLHKKNDLQATNYVAWSLRSLLTTSMLFFLLMPGLMFIIPSVVRFTAGTFKEYHLSIYMLWLSPILAVTILLSNFVLANRKVYFYAFISILMPNILILAAFGIASWLLDSIDKSTTITIIMLFAYVSLLLLQIIIVLNLFPRKLIKNGIKSLFLSKENQLWRKTSLRLVVNRMALSILFSVDLLIVEFFGKDKRSVDYYAACLIIVSITWLITRATQSFIKSEISLFIHKKSQILQSIVNKINLTQFSLCALIFVIIVYFSHSLLHLFGKHYVSATTPLIILSIACLIDGVTAMGANMLAYGGKERTVLYMNIFQLILLMILGIIMTRLYNLIGIATSTAIVLLINAILVIYFNRKYFPRIKSMIII